VRTGYRTDRVHDEEQFTADLDALLAARPVNTSKYYGSPLNAFHDWMAETLHPETIRAVLYSPHQYSLSYSAYRALAQRQSRLERKAERERQAA
jgi:hypothetical protein